MKIIFIIIVGIVLFYAFSGSDNSINTMNNNYGQFDKGTPQCDKGTYGDVNGLCNWLFKFKG